jgi:hypothetical protein
MCVCACVLIGYFGRFVVLFLAEYCVAIYSRNLPLLWSRDIVLLFLHLNRFRRDGLGPDARPTARPHLRRVAAVVTRTRCAADVPRPAASQPRRRSLTHSPPAGACNAAPKWAACISRGLRRRHASAAGAPDHQRADGGGARVRARPDGARQGNPAPPGAPRTHASKRAHTCVRRVCARTFMRASNTHTHARTRSRSAARATRNATCSSSISAAVRHAPLCVRYSALFDSRILFLFIYLMVSFSPPNSSLDDAVVCVCGCARARLCLCRVSVRACARAVV